jgi:hypothetical protein
VPRRLLGRWAILPALLVFLPFANGPTAGATPYHETSLGIRQTPLAATPEYGVLESVADAPNGGLLLASTRDGVEVRAAASVGGAPVGFYRSADRVRAVAGSGARAVLFQGSRGLALLDLADPSAPSLLVSLVLPHDADRGAMFADGSCAAMSDSFLQVVRLDSGTDLRLIETRSFSDGRRLVRARARGDSLLVVAARTGALPRLYLTLYRLPAGATSLVLVQEWIFNARGATDADWDGRIAFVADGNAGIHGFDMTTGAAIQTTPIIGGRFVRAVAMNAASVYAAGEAATLQRFARVGALGESLLTTPDEALELEPVSLAVVGSRPLVATRDVVTAAEPDEVGRSQIEFPVSSEVALPPVATIGSIGRSRRLVVNGGFVYVADYGGGLRIYRAGGADTSLVGVVPPQASGRAVDLALDVSTSRIYLASQSSGLEVIDVADPFAPVRRGSLVLPGLASAVTVLDASTVAVARTGSGSSPGVTIVDVATPTAPFARGSTNAPFVQSPRALALRDTVLFVADDQLGVLSIGVGNFDAPATFGLPSGATANDLDLQGTLLLVATRGRGLQVVDVFDPTSPVLRSELFLPPVSGVTRQGNSAIACLADQGVAIVDLSQPSAAAVRSVVAAGGRPRDAVWSGDTLLIAVGTSIERFLLAPAIPPSTALTVTLDPASAQSRVLLSWNLAPTAGQVGWNVFRDRGVPTAGTATPGGGRVNDATLAPTARQTEDHELVAGKEHRYRLEAVFADGRVRTLAEGSLFVPSNPRLGRPYPNPFRAGRGVVTVPYRVIAGNAPITLRIADVRGRLLREIVSLSPPLGGFGTIQWDGRDRNGRAAASGVYYVHVRGPGIDDARAVILLR